MACTEKCKEQLAARNQAIHEWIMRWPNACKSCHGAGLFGSFGSHWEPPSEEPCDDCTEQGVCARCGQEGLEPFVACTVCGWNYDDQEPPPHECGCWYAEELAAEDARSLDEQPPF
jgi:hypothetical protein